MANFQHEALESPSEQIRLIQLLPRGADTKTLLVNTEASRYVSNSSLSNCHDTFSGLINCTIKHVSLDDHPEYTAISYTWGSSERSHSISINGACYKVTESLVVMLENFQTEHEPLTLWIDQLCINQDSNEEKEAQVPLMKRIYQQAIQTIVWLGPAADDSESAIEFLAHVGRQAYEFNLMELTLPELQNWSTEDEKDEKRQKIKESLDILTDSVGSSFPVESYGKLITRPWFSRVWVVQEVSLAKKVIFRSGEKDISYDHLRAASFFYTFQVWNVTRKSQELEGMKSEENNRMIARLNTVNTSLMKVMLSSRRKYQDQTGGAGESLFALLKKFYVTSTRNTKLGAKYPHDRIYGLLGLANDLEQLQIKVNYKRSCIESYTDVAAKLIEHGHVDLLALSQFPKALESEEVGTQLPSWVPDWTATILKPCGEFSAIGASFKASGTARAAVVGDRQPGRATGLLELKGVRIDQIESVGSLWKPSIGGQFPPPDGYTLLKEVEEFCEASAGKAQEIYKPPQRREEAIWRVPIGDKEFNAGGLPLICRATAISQQGHQAIFKTFTMLERIRKNSALLARMGIGMPNMDSMQKPGAASASSASSSIPRSRAMSPPAAAEEGTQNRGMLSYMGMMGDMQNRRPFLSQRGYVGLGPADMQPGDIIYVLLGSTVPYVLRPSGSSCFTFVGEAYCDGVMDGEIMEDAPREEVLSIS